MEPFFSDDRLAESVADGAGEDGTVIDEGMELAVFATGFHAVGEIVEEVPVELSADELAV